MFQDEDKYISNLLVDQLIGDTFKPHKSSCVSQQQEINIKWLIVGILIQRTPYFDSLPIFDASKADHQWPSIFEYKNIKDLLIQPLCYTDWESGIVYLQIEILWTILEKHCNIFQLLDVWRSEENVFQKNLNWGKSLLWLTPISVSPSCLIFQI